MITDLTNILAVLTGPYGVVAAEAIVIFFLWKLYREALATGARAQENVTKLTEATNDLVTAVSTYREGQTKFIDAFERFMDRWTAFAADVRAVLKQ